MSGELLLILVVALLVFGPDKLSMLAQHLAKLVNAVHKQKQDVMAVWQQTRKALYLKENIKKAEQAEASYEKKDEKVDVK